MNKKLLILVIMVMATLVLAACGNDSDEVSNPPESDNATNEENATENNNTDNGTTENNTETGNKNNTTNQESPYNFTSFDLEADIEGTNDAVDVDYEHENDGTEASYEDKNQGVQLVGDEAMEELDSIFSSFDFDENTPDDEVLNLVFEAFNIPEDAENVELDIDFNSGTEKEYRQ